MTKGFHYPIQFSAESALLEINLVNIATKAEDSTIEGAHMEEGQL